MSSSGYETLRVALNRGALTITLDRPEAKNAMSFAMVEELLAVVDAAEADEAVRVIVLRGANGVFSAGGDVKDMARTRASAEPGQPDPIIAVNRRFGEMAARFSNTPKPVVAAVEGPALGGAMGLVCVADVAIAAPSARFGLPETGLGLVPAQVIPPVVERLGYSQAKRLAVLGGLIDAAEALRIGLVHELADDLDAAVERTVARMMNGAPGALAAAKELTRRARFAPAGTMIDYAAEVFAASLKSEEGREGTEAFVAKRKPRWALPSPRLRGEGARRVDEGHAATTNAGEDP